MRQLILGGARSGKSQLAQNRATDSGKDVIYIATAQSGDGEMEERIKLHRDNRPQEWEVLEVPEKLVDTLDSLSGQGKTVLVDCLTLWVTNILLNSDLNTAEQLGLLVSAVEKFEGNLLLVSNEVGWGIVPMGELSRQFQDNTGRLHQDLAAVVEKVSLCVAGIPVEVKGEAL